MAIPRVHGVPIASAHPTRFAVEVKRYLDLAQTNVSTVEDPVTHIDKDILLKELVRELHKRKSRRTRKRHIVAFWCALAFIAAFILGCWVVS